MEPATYLLATGVQLLLATGSRATKLLCTAAQVREAADLVRGPAPDLVPVSIGSCTDGPDTSCPLEKFLGLVETSIKKECVHTTAP